MITGVFDSLTPKFVIAAVEQALGTALDGTMVPYPSYINRVYGLQDENGNGLVVKFYRPGRWSEEALLEEHDFIRDCGAEEIPVALPLEDEDGQTLFEAEAVTSAGEQTFFYAVFQKRAGRNFDIHSDEDWLRLGRLVGRMHLAGKRSEAPERIVCTPEETTAVYLQELRDEKLIHPDVMEEFTRVTESVLARITPLFKNIDFHRVHGDCHRGNVLDRPGEGLLIIDFDDMMNAPAVQDLWLLLPDHAQNSIGELGLLLTGYEEFLEFDRTELNLIEPLRFMRMIYYLVWCARQRRDAGFSRAFPNWGNKAFWLKEVEDLNEQASILFNQEDFSRYV